MSLAGALPDLAASWRESSFVRGAWIAQMGGARWQRWPHWPPHEGDGLGAQPCLRVVMRQQLGLGLSGLRKPPPPVRAQSARGIAVFCS